MLQAIHYNGLENLTQTMCKNIQNMKQKMLRFPQHLDYIRSLEKCGLLANDPIQLATDLWIRPIDITAKSLARGVVLDIKHTEYEKHNLLTENSLPSTINSLRAS